MSHKEYSLISFIDINPKTTFRENLRNRIQDQLMWMGLDAKKYKEMIHQDTDTEGKYEEHIVIPVFHLDSRVVGDMRGKYRITTIVYEIRCTPSNIAM